MAAPVKPKLIVEDESLPPLGRAAHIGLLILKATGANTWEALTEDLAAQARVRLTVEQQEALYAHSEILQHLQRVPLRTITGCAVCGRWVLASKRPGKSSTCPFTLGCAGDTFYVTSTPKRTPSVKTGVSS